MSNSQNPTTQAVHSENSVSESSTDNTSPATEGAPQAAAEAEPVKPDVYFEHLGLPPGVLANVRAAGYQKATPIQGEFIPRALTGVDVMGQAKTGTGKTAAFLLPIFSRVQPGTGKNPRVLILAPTRELALQIHTEALRLGPNLGFRSVTLYGGTGYDQQTRALESGVDLVVGTPGRVMDHMRQGRLSLAEVQVAVLDEADRMLDLGFRKDIEYILRHCPKERQTLLLSATIPDDIMKLALRYMREPEEIWTAPETLTVDQVEQYYISVESERKLPTLLKILDSERPGLAIIFCSTKRWAKKLAARLLDFRLNAREIHGDLVQSKREKIMGNFRTGKVQLLVATDVASRGIDVRNITHIINYDIPFRAEDYVHRIGRTGRIGSDGKAFTFVTREEGEVLTEIELFINRQLQEKSFETLDSIFWPNPPEKLPPEFTGGDEETAMSDADYLGDEEDGAKGERERGGGGGGGGRSRGKEDRGGRRRGGRGRNRERGNRGEHGERGPRAPQVEGQTGVGLPDGGTPHLSGNAGSYLDVLEGEPAGDHAGDWERPLRREDAAPGDSVANLDEHGDVDGNRADGAGHSKGARREGGQGGRDGPRRNRNRNRRGGREREPVQVICSACGQQALVRFKPQPDRPVYCDPCFSQRKAARQSEQAGPAEPAGGVLENPAPSPNSST